MSLMHRRPGTVAMMALACTLSLASMGQRRGRGPAISASSQYENESGANSPDLAFDGLLTTSWAEGVAREGEGEYIELDFGETRTVESVTIWGGNFSSEDDFEEYSRLSVATLELFPEEGDPVVREVEFANRYARKSVGTGEVQARRLRITINEAFRGSVLNQTHIAEVAVNYRRTESDVEQAIDAWLAEEDQVEAKTAFDEQLQTAFREARDGTSYFDNFKLIGLTAAQGTPLYQQAVMELAPVGYRANYIGLHEDAVNMLARLEDVNALPWLSMASQLSGSSDRDWIQSIVDQFQALEELRRLRNARSLSWGGSGLRDGSLNGQGQAVALDVDIDGNLWVADVGNNRLQRFGPDGGHQQTIGAEGDPGLCRDWFQRERVHPCAAPTGAENGQFRQPLYVAVGRDGDVAAIDSQNRVSMFDPEGTFVRAFVIESEWKPTPGRGSAPPIISWWRDEFFFVLGRDVHVYNYVGEKQRQFTLEEDVRAAVIVAGKLLVEHFDNEVTEYSLDGFRQGRTFIRGIEGIPQDGSEDIDFAADAEDRLLVVTDAGNLHMFRRNGRHEASWEAFPRGVVRPRMAIDGATVYVTNGDAIERFTIPEAE